MGRVGLVLGAGGVVGQAYHAGVLAALADRCGWDARTADVIVGSSAGSVTGTLLRLGVAPADLAAVATHAPLSTEGAVLMDRILPSGQHLPHPSPASLLRPLRPPTPALVARLLRNPWSVRPSTAAMTLLPAGTVDLTDRAVPLQQLVGDRWPDDLWICAVRRDDARRVVFGRSGAPRAPLAAAVLASCAIPAYFAPVTIDGVEYFDGGVHSPTSADVLGAAVPDVAVVVSPMSAARFPVRAPDALVRWAAHRMLDRECRILDRDGTVVVRIEPGPAALEVMGVRPMDEDRTDRVATVAYEETVRRIAAGALRADLASTHRRTTAA